MENDSSDEESERKSNHKKQEGYQSEEDTEELSLFRQKWKAELQQQVQVGEGAADEESVTKLSQAEELYWMGVSAEESKDMTSAILYYRQAIQLVPDIERRATSKPHASVSHNDVQSDEDTDIITQTVSVLSLTDTTSTDCSQFCYPNIYYNDVVHISDLPVEIMRYIIQLFVLSDLDLRSLEQFAMVCKGFYLLAREKLIWQKACLKIWSELSGVSHDWRHLYITRPHVHFNGVYISRSTYVRQGERSLDRLYKPFHTVIYYRYLRFFADGTVLYTTSPEEPAVVVNKLRFKKHNSSILMGYYTHSNDDVFVVVNRNVVTSETQSPRSHIRKLAPPIVYDQRFHMELGLKHSVRKLSSQLNWKQFSCHTIHRLTGQLQIADFNIDYTYTPFYFSRVKSYSLFHQHR